MNTATVTPEALLKASALKMTNNRCRVLQQLLTHESSRQPVTAETIHLELSHLGQPTGLSTVYRVLSTLEAHGLVRRYRSQRGKSLYELILAQSKTPERAGLQIISMDDQSVASFYDPLLQQRLVEFVHQQGYRLIDQNIKVYVRSN